MVLMVSKGGWLPKRLPSRDVPDLRSSKLSMIPCLNLERAAFEDLNSTKLLHAIREELHRTADARLASARASKNVAVGAVETLSSVQRA